MSLAKPIVSRLNPSTVFDGSRLGFSQAVVCESPRTIYVAGQTACDQFGRPLGSEDVIAQSRHALANVESVLQATGSGSQDIVQMTVFIVNFNNSVVGALLPVFTEFYGSHRPASSWVGVESLMHPDFLIEIAVIAIPHLDIDAE